MPESDHSLILCFFISTYLLIFFLEKRLRALNQRTANSTNLLYALFAVFTAFISMANGKRQKIYLINSISYTINHIIKDIFFFALNATTITVLKPWFKKRLAINIKK